jgi:hypothetical protein
VLSSLATLLVAFLPLNLAVQAQDSSVNSKPSVALALATSKTAKSSAKFNQMVTDTQQALAISPSASLPKFVAHRDYLAADGPENLAMGDLNGDGIPDLVVPNGNSSNVSVLLGNRDGSFRQFHLFDTGGGGAFDVVIADFNGDGKNDVAVTNAEGVSILLGDGLGHLDTPTVLPAGVGPSRLVAADFNGDHKVDLAVTNLGSNTVSIFLGRGNGTFTHAGNLAVGMGPVGVAVGDFNHDGKADLAVANSGIAFDNNEGPEANTLAILLGNGNGRFRAPTFIPVAKTPLVVVVNDFNKDDKQDLAVSNFAGGFVSELLGNGNGTFQAPREFKVGSNADGITVADFNGDGNPDIAVTNGNGNNTITDKVAILFGDGEGSFKPRVVVGSGRVPVAVLAGDFNHDGKADYMTANFDANTVSVVLGKGDGTFFDIGPGIPTNSAFPSQTITADFNNDGIPDLALVNGDGQTPGNSVSILLGKQRGGFETAKVFAAALNPIGLAAGDFNHDGHLDLAVAAAGESAESTGSLGILLGNGDGTFRAPHLFDPGPGRPTTVAVADFNGDGNLDVVLGEDALTFGPASIELLLGDGKGGFGQFKPIDLFQQIGASLQNVISADFNRDGKPDIAYLGTTDRQEVAVQLSNGNGTFQAAKVVTTASQSGPLLFSQALGDFNNDGNLDFAVEEDGVIEVLLGDGHGDFTSKGKFPDGSGSGFSAFPSVILADFNGDGFLDAAAPDAFGTQVSVWLGHGDGTLGPVKLFAGGFTDSAVAIDFPGFQPSIVLATETGPVLVLRNATPSK